MKHLYTFLPLILLWMLLSMLLGKNIQAQTSKIVKTRKITLNDSCDGKTIILKSDSIISALCGAKLDLSALNDSMIINYHIKLDSINLENFHLTSDPINWIDSLHKNMKTFSKQIKVVCSDSNSNIIFVKDNGEEITIERNGEMVFIKKNERVKDIESDVKVEETEDGETVIILQTRIIVKDVPQDEKSDLAKKGIASDKNQLNLEYLNFYPNPSNGMINVSYKLSEEGSTTIKVFNTLGNAVYSEVANNQGLECKREINLSSYPAGTYYIQVQQGKRTVTKKLIIQ